MCPRRVSEILRVPWQPLSQLDKAINGVALNSGLSQTKEIASTVDGPHCIIHGPY